MIPGELVRQGLELDAGGGTRQVADAVTDLDAKSGAIRILGPSDPPGSQNSGIYSDSGDPDGVLAVPAGSIYLRADGGSSTGVLFVKRTASASATGWRRVPLIEASSTGNRPTPTHPGTPYFDTSLGKPIWWNGSAWVDATGTTV